MNVIVVSQSLSRARTIALDHKILAAAGFALLALFAAAVFGGYQLAANAADPQLVAQVESMKGQLAAQREQLLATRDYAEDHLNALTVRMGELQARATRLDALGERLAQLGELDESEFHFSALPGLGGPEEPISSVGLAEPNIANSLAQLEKKFGNQGRELDALERLIADRDIDKRFVPAGRPVASGWVSSNYGSRTDPFTGKPSRHNGVDFSGVDGAEILSVADGVVNWVGPRPGYGNTIDIDHGNGYITRYAHNREHRVEVGQRVRAGDVIALMGRTGRATGPNVHFEVWYNGRRLDPIAFIRSQRGEHSASPQG